MLFPPQGPPNWRKARLSLASTLSAKTSSTALIAAASFVSPAREGVSLAPCDGCEGPVLGLHSSYWRPAVKHQMISTPDVEHLVPYRVRYSNGSENKDDDSEDATDGD